MAGPRSIGTMRPKPLKHELEMAVDVAFRRFANVQASAAMLPRESMDQVVADEFEATMKAVAQALGLETYLDDLEKRAVDRLLKTKEKD